MYEGVHNLHHARTRYGTTDDPEYLPLALMRPWTLPVFIVVSALAPVALLFRFAILTPLSALSPTLRGIVVERYSSLSINPAFRRRAPEGEARTQWLRIEAACSAWAIALILLVATGTMSLSTFAIVMGVASGVAVLNQVRTLVAHLWENEGETMTVTAQYLDTVNVPPPTLLPALWAPVGLRYHALHHLLPGVALSRAGRSASADFRRAGRSVALSPRELSGSAGAGAPHRAQHDGRALAAYSSLRISTTSPIIRNSRNGAQAARKGG